MYLLAAISLGFLGSLHCLGMCGPIALALPVRNKTIGAYFLSALVYNLGRVVSYSVLGLLFGAIGHGFVMAGWQNILSVTIGMLILLLLFVPYLRKFRPRYLFLYHVIENIKSGIRRLFHKSSYSSLFLIGVLNGWLPCGLVYLAVAGSLATGSMWQGSLFMAFFALGTVPAMLSLSILGRYISMRFRQNVRKLVPVFAGIMALMLILRGLNLSIPYISPAVKTNEQGIHIQSCCHK